THTKPDGDAVGSLLALHLALENTGKKVFSYTDTPPDTYRFLPGFEKLKNADEFETPGKNIVIILDSSNIDRCPVSNLENTEQIINIDHHLDNSGFGNINYIDSSASSTGILIYRLLTEMRLTITPDVAENLYTAIITDTGRFSFSNTDPETFCVIAELVKAGASPQKLTEHIYKNYSLKNARIFGKVLSSLEEHGNGRILTIELSYDTVQQMEIGEHETEGMMEYIQGIDGQEVSLFFKEFAKNVTRVSLRSRGRIDVQQVAEKHNGGGHKFAAGCTIEHTVAEAKSLLIKEISTALHRGE
ncbi:MAG: bifunctional oligoribonuclease/PAP phosphatase NrnA, partial [Acidobacteria bacterium]|nr:bifunctional oligoribonuclease/PAP phosphatase NrnA [Acidobacteriota bacterium]